MFLTLILKNYPEFSKHNAFSIKINLRKAKLNYINMQVLYFIKCCKLFYLITNN